MSQDNGPNFTNVFDAGAIGILPLVFANILPAIATVLTVVWMIIRIYETDTVQKLCKKKSPKPVVGGEDDADPV